MNWNTTRIEQTVTEGQTVKVEFKKLTDKKVTDLDPHCGCTSYEWNGDILEVYIRLDLVSFVLPKPVYANKKEYTKYTFLDVYYEDGTKEKLEVSLTVTEIPGKNAK